MVGPQKKLSEKSRLGKYTMGKKKKKDKKKRRGMYNKAQFHDIVCQHCSLCSIYNPTFCYEQIYKQSPNRFMFYCYGALLGMRYSFEKKGFSPKDIGITDFRMVFCHSGICTGSPQYACTDALECFKEFKGQIKGKFIGKLGKSIGRFIREDKEYLYKAYPTFFTNDNEEWKAKVKEILESDN